MRRRNSNIKIVDMFYEHHNGKDLPATLKRSTVFFILSLWLILKGTRGRTREIESQETY